MVAQRTLNPLVQVRALARQPASSMRPTPFPQGQRESPLLVAVPMTLSRHIWSACSYQVIVFPGIFPLLNSRLAACSTDNFVTGNAGFTNCLGFRLGCLDYLYATAFIIVS